MSYRFARPIRRLVRQLRYEDYFYRELPEDIADSPLVEHLRLFEPGDKDLFRLAELPEGSARIMTLLVLRVYLADVFFLGSDENATAFLTVDVIDPKKRQNIGQKPGFLLAVAPSVLCLMAAMPEVYKMLQKNKLRFTE